MSFQPNLDITFGDAQLKPILTDLAAAKKALDAIATVSLSNEEIRHYHHINQNVLPMVQRAVTELGPNQNTLPPTRISNAQAQRLLEALLSVRQLQHRLDEFQQGAKGLSANLEHLLYEYTQRVYAHDGAS